MTPRCAVLDDQPPYAALRLPRQHLPRRYRRPARAAPGAARELDRRRRLDVFDHEPLPDDHPLRTLPSVLALPHLGYVTRRNDEGYFQQAVRDITAFLAGSPIRQLG